MTSNPRICLALTLALLTTTIASPQKTADPEVQLKAARQLALLDGDLPGAIEIYKTIVDTPGVNPATAAAALVSMAGAYQKQGNTAAAQKAYERVGSQFREQTTAVAEAKTALARLATPTAQAALREAMPQKLMDFRPGAISPDGRYYASGAVTYPPDVDFVALDRAFSTPASVGFVIHDFTTGQDQQLINPDIKLRTPADVFQFGWQVAASVFSSDGRKIAYQWVDNSGGPDELRIVSVDAKGDAAPSIVLRGGNYVSCRPFGWSSDSKRIFALLTLRDHTYSIAAVSVSDGAINILKPLEWKSPNKLSVSPDGRWVAYDAPRAQESTDREILILSTENKNETPIAQKAESQTMPSWTPDGNSVVYLSDRSGAMGLWGIRITDGKATGEPVLVRGNVGRISPLGFANDGSLYYRMEEESSTIFTAEIDLSEGKVVKPPTRINNLPGGFSFAPRWSPDGAKLAFFTKGIDGFMSIVVRSASGDERPIPTVFTGASGMTWFPDGQSVVFFAHRTEPEPEMLHRIDLQTGKELLNRTILRESTMVDAQAAPLFKVIRDIDRKRMINPVVSLDARRVYFIKEAADNNAKKLLMMYELDTGREMEILPDQYQAEFLVTPDGQVVFQPGTGISVTTAAGAPARTLQAPRGSWPVKVSDDGKLLLIQQKTSDEGGPLWWVPMDGGAAQRIGTGVYPRIESLNPDGKRIAFTRADKPRSELWVLKDLVKSASSQPNVTKTVFTAPIDPATGSIRGAATRFTQSPTGWDARPAWSPDGKSIAFKRRAADGNYEIVVRSLQNPTEKTYGRNNGAPIGGGPPRWFPEGNALLQINNDPAKPGQGGTGFERLDLTTREFKAIPELDFKSANPLTAFSQEGKTFYAVATISGRDNCLVVFDLTTKQRKRVIELPTTRGIREIALSPDGRTMAIGYFPDAEGKVTLARVSVDGGPVKELYKGSVRYLAWTKDSGILFGESDNADNWRLMRIAATGAGKPEFTGLQVKGLETIDVSRDGTHIAFSGVEVLQTGGTR